MGFYIFLFIIIILQLAQLAMLQRVFSNKNVHDLGEWLHAQTAKQTETLRSDIASAKTDIAEGTEAAHAAFEIANTVNLKLEKLGLANKAEADAIEAAGKQSQKGKR